MSKLRRNREQRKADRKQKRQAPKVKMRSYGDGEKLPIVKSGGDFYLADQKYDNLGHGEFEGQMTGKLQGPSKRAIKGKGKKSANVRVGHGENRASDDGNVIFLEDTSPIKIKNDYSSMRSMGQAVAKWTSPHKLTGKVSRKEQDKESVKKYGVAGSSKRTEKAKKSIAKDEAKAKKKEYKESEEGKEATAKKKEDVTAAVNQLGKGLQLFATGDAEETATERKKKAKSEEEKRKKTKSAGPTFEEQIEEKPKTTTETDSGKDKDVISLSTNK